jgi:hypothetical protein
VGASCKPGWTSMGRNRYRRIPASARIATPIALDCLRRGVRRSASVDLWTAVRMKPPAPRAKWHENRFAQSALSDAFGSGLCCISSAKYLGPCESLARKSKVRHVNGSRFPSMLALSRSNSGFPLGSECDGQFLRVRARNLSRLMANVAVGGYSVDQPAHRWKALSEALCQFCSS